MACGACHDWIDWTTGKSTVKDKKDHPGGPQANDAGCVTCHQADSGGTAKPVAVAHKVQPPAFQHKVELALTAPKNGKFFLAGESPQLTITIKDAKSGATIDPKTMVEPKDATKVQPNEWRRANLYVSGPRNNTKPVLTTLALLPTPDATKTYMNIELRVLNDPSKADPRISRTATSVVYQLADVKGLEPGTYTAFVETIPSAPLGGWALLNFQVGTETVEKKTATNCLSCHEDTRMHASFFAVTFEPDICKSCHDYQRQMPGKAAWTDRNAGFGAAPLARRIHGVHFGHYLEKPKEVHATEDYSHTIFPQDVRNCTKCHSETAEWKEQPSRLACNACHDTEEALFHTSMMTKDPTPADPWSGDELETCKTCHGAGREFSADKVHNISKPYEPPYPREHPHWLVR
jgi:hypothetical protein